MPRPGPRPYECVRRAWHSERHQPMRGSLIKEIFRIAHEIHSLPTKKNKEWQEKLPIVVLKAEEIMYSKANSEAEYMDPKTLLERVNDAIDTIIRRDEDSETGGLLQPCIEAALQLGCIPRRASRSQRNSNPRFYLGPYSLNKGDGTFKTTSNLAPQHPNFLNSNMLSSELLGPGPQKRDFHMYNGDMNILPVTPYPAYPLYYETYLPPDSQPGFMAPLNNLKPSFASDKNILNTDSITAITEENQPEELACDLSLRLAPLSFSATSNLLGECRDNLGPNASLVKRKQRLPLCPDLCLSSGMMESQAGRIRKRHTEVMEDDQRYRQQPKLVCKFSQEFQPPLKHDKFSFLINKNET
ncbi:hypothetical protein V2J09_013521 [Rumex salicifolius]